MLRSKIITRACPLLSFFITATTALHAQVEHGALRVNGDVDPPLVTLSQSASPTVSIPFVNPGDYWIHFRQDQATQHGVMISSVANNGRNGNYPTSSVAVDRDTPEYLLEYFLPIHRSDPDGGDEMDIDVAFAYFPYDEFLGGHAENAVNGGAFTNILGSSTTGITLGVEFNENASGTADDDAGAYTLNLLTVDPTATPSNGILLVSGGKNEDNYALSKANKISSTWTLFTHDNYVHNDAYERDPIAFVYLPTNKEHVQIPALGRINDNGAPDVSRGDFTVTFTGKDKPWHLEIPGHSPDTGTLIISPQGGDGNNVDNIWSYEWDSANRHWVIESRDLVGLNLQSLGGEPAFSFAFITKPPVYVDADATGTNDGSSWENAYTSLWTATYNAKTGDQIWVAAGTYLSSGTNDNDDSIELKDSVRLYGGFKGNETLLSQRDPYANETIITGERGDPGDDSDNAYNVVTARFQTGGYNVLDGFTITGGRARSEVTQLARGGGLAIETTEPVEIANCRFLDNSAKDNGGAVYVHTDATVTFTNCAFQGNQATEGGAVYVSEENRLTFSNCVFQGNLATNRGGALSAPIPDSYLELISCSLQGNRSGSIGSAIYEESNLKLINTVIWGNQDGELSPDESINQLHDSEGSTLTTSHSLVQNRDLSGFNDLAGVDPRFFRPIDPALAPTTEGNLALRNTSPLIDQGSNDAVYGPFDVSGFPRQVNNRIDIGAHEASQAFSIAPNVAAAGNAPTEIQNWFTDGSIEQYENAFTQQETHGDFQVAGAPTIDYETGTLDITFSDTTIALLNYTLTLTPYDGSHAPVHLDFTVKVGPHTLYVDPTANAGNHSGSSWQNALPTLARALEYSESGDTIYVAAGSYRPDDGARYEYNTRAATFQLQSGVALYGGFPAGGAAFAERDHEANETILDGSDIFYRIVTGSGTDATAILDGFTLSNGYYIEDTEGGAGLFNNAGSPTIANCTFAENSCWTPATGSAIANRNGSNPTITNCRFLENQGRGTIANIENSNPTITDCLFIGNFGEGEGGAILNRNSSPVIANCHFEENSATLGGAIYNEGSSPSVTDSTFLDNRGEQGGGAVYNDDSSPTFESCHFHSNSAGVNGGAFYISDSGTTTLLNCELTENQSNSSGSAIYKIDDATLDISGTRFERNFTDTSSGGAIYLSAGSASFDDVEFVENEAASGGAVYAFFCELDLQRSSFTRNRSAGRAGAVVLDQANTTIDTTAFHGNRANSVGGAIESIKSTLLVSNSVFVHNRSNANYGGAVFVDSDSTFALLNSTLTENRAETGGGIWAKSPVLLTNSIIWKNDNADSAPSQVEGPGGIAPESASNIIQGLPGGFDPLFVLSPDPVENDLPEDTSKIHYGNLRLQPDSPAVDAGANPDSPTALDLGGNARIQNTTIDIGPYEGYRDNYYYLFGHLDPDGDYNNNGYTNWEDYAHSADPSSKHNFSRFTRIEYEDGEPALNFSYRPNREDVFVDWQQSSTLEPDSWAPLEQGKHYQRREIDAEDALVQIHYFLGDSLETPIFYRQVLSKTPR